MKTLFAIIVIMVGLFSAQATQAKSDFQDVLFELYKPYEKSLSERSCASCHKSTSDFGFNPYGKQIAQELVAAGKKDLTADILQKIEPLDADGDGTSNIDEIKAGTDPGDPKSGGKPGAAPKPETAPATTTEAPKPKKSLVPKNVYHPAVVHFPIALFIAGLLFDLIGQLKKRSEFLLMGWYNLILAAVTGLAGVATGLLAVFRMKVPLSNAVINQHMILAIASVILMWIMAGLRVHRHEKMNAPMRVVYYLLACAALAAISYSGHLGGVFVYGE